MGIGLVSPPACILVCVYIYGDLMMGHQMSL